MQKSEQTVQEYTNKHFKHYQVSVHCAYYESYPGKSDIINFHENA